MKFTIEDDIDSECDAMYEVSTRIHHPEVQREGRLLLQKVFIHLQARMRAIATEGR